MNGGISHFHKCSMTQTQWGKCPTILFGEKMEPIPRHKMRCKGKRCVVIVRLAYDITKALCQKVSAQHCNLMRVKSLQAWIAQNQAVQFVKGCLRCWRP
jgi:hypothetical protein